MEEIEEVSLKMEQMKLTSNPIIPFDLLTIEILTRLPTKSLIRFKTVSKQWLSTISSRKFVNLHAQRTHTNDHNHGVLIETRGSPIFNEGSVVLRHDNFSNVTFEHYKFPLSTSDEGFSILGSCNGLVCLYICCKGIIIWNPVTQEHRFVPKPSMINPGLWGLAYLPSIDDHKLVNLNLCSSEDRVRFQVSVFTLRTNNWVQYMSADIVDNLLLNTHIVLGIVLLNNVSHWLIYQWKAVAAVGVPFILAFDMVTETFNEVPLPKDMKSFQYASYNLSRIKDNLCLEAEYRSDDGSGRVLYQVVWELKRYGEWGSWKKIVELCAAKQDSFEIRDIHDLDGFGSNIYKESYLFLMYMLQSNGWFIYRSNDGRHKCIQLDKLHCVRLVCSHVEALVSPLMGSENRLEL